jgi:UDP-glucose 6-dehydrogenase
MIQQNVAAGRLRFSTDIAAAVGESDVVFLTVGTPDAATVAPTCAPWTRWRRRWPST